MLSSYEPTEWNITGNGVNDLSQVLLYGYHDQSVTGLGGQTSVTEYSALGTGIYHGYSYNIANDPDVANHVLSSTGLSVDAFNGRYTGTQFAITARAVPEPSSLWLLSAVGLVAGLRRRKRSA